MTTSLDLTPVAAGATTTISDTAVNGSPLATTATSAVPASARLAPLYSAHDALRADFDRLGQAARAADQAGLDAWLATVTVRFARHQSGEDDLLWPALRGRVMGADASLTTLSGQRARIEQLMARASEPARPANERAELAAELVQQVGAYLDAKESLVFPLFLRHLETMPAAGLPTGPALDTRLRSVGFGWFTSDHAGRTAGRRGSRTAPGVGRLTVRLRHRHA